MAIEDLLKSETGKGMAIGLGAALLAPMAIAALSGVARPLARAVVKSGIVLYEKGREAMAEVGEVVDDLVAEARSELGRNQVATAAEPTDKTPGGA